jgi:hypothetical protein
MRTVDAVHLFKINDLRVDGSFLTDASARAANGGIRVVVPQMAPPGSEGWLSEAPTNRYFDGWWDSSELFSGWVESDTQPPSIVAYTVRMLAVVVDAEVDSAARDKALQQDPALDPATVEPFLRRFVDFVRADGKQPDVGRFESLDIRYFVSQFCDKTTGVRLDHWPRQPPVTVNFDTRTPNLTREQACEYVALALDGRSPSLAASLYADALHDYDIHRKVLMTAVAVEIAVKEMLIRAAGPDQAALADLLLNNPRNYSMSQILLFDAAAQAVCGRSLKLENKKLYKTMAALILNRNRLVHKLSRDINPVADLQRQIEAASEAMAWCDSIRQSKNR